jgi:chromosome segregation ATPase
MWFCWNCCKDNDEAEEVARLQTDLESIRREAARKDKELDSVRRERSSAIEEARAKDDMLTALSHEVTDMKDKFKEMGKALEESRRQYQELDGEFRRQSDQLKTLTEEAQYLRLQHNNEALDLSPTQSSMLRGPSSNSRSGTL